MIESRGSAQLVAARTQGREDFAKANESIGTVVFPSGSSDEISVGSLPPGELSRFYRSLLISKHRSR